MKIIRLQRSEPTVEDTDSDVDESLHEVYKELLEQDSDLCRITTADPASVCATCGLSELVLALFYTTILLELAASAVEWHDVTDYGLCLGKDGAVVEID